MFSKKYHSFCVLTASGFLLTGCGKHPDKVSWWQNEREKIELGQQLELKQFRFGQLRSHDFEDFQRLQMLTAQSAAELVSLLRRRETLRMELSKIEGQRLNIRNVVLGDLRQRALGKSFDLFKPVLGREYRNVSVSAIDDVGVTIRHSEGSARLHYADLDEQQHVMFGLDEETSLAAEAKETENAAAYERCIETRMTAAFEKEERAAVIEREALAGQQKHSLPAAQQTVVSTYRTLAQPATPVGTGSWNGYYSNYRVRRPIYYYYSIIPYHNSSCFPTSIIQAGRVVRSKNSPYR